MKNNKKSPAELLGAKVMTVQNLERIKGGLLQDGKPHNGSQCQHPTQYQGQQQNPTHQGQQETGQQQQIG